MPFGKIIHTLLQSISAALKEIKLGILHPVQLSSLEEILSKFFSVFVCVYNFIFLLPQLWNLLFSLNPQKAPESVDLLHLEVEKGLLPRATSAGWCWWRVPRFYSEKSVRRGACVSWRFLYPAWLSAAFSRCHVASGLQVLALNNTFSHHWLSGLQSWSILTGLLCKSVCIVWVNSSKGQMLPEGVVAGLLVLFLLPGCPVSCPEKLASFLFTPRPPPSLASSSNASYTLSRKTCIWGQCFFVCFVFKFEWDPAFMLPHMQWKHVVSWNLALCSLQSMMYLDLFSFFLLNLKEKCLSGDPVYWFPIRDQQSRTQCVLAVALDLCLGMFKALSPSACDHGGPSS